MNVFTKYAWIKASKDQKCKTVLNGFIEIVNESNRKPNKLWFDQGKVLYDMSMQKWLDSNNILMYSTHNGGKDEVLRISLCFGKLLVTFKFS